MIVMKRTIVLSILCVLTAYSVAEAQTPIPNGDFEEWKNYPGSGPFKSYDEPTGGWASGNGAIHVAPGADPVCERSSDAVSGQWSAKMTTRRIFNQIAGGSLYLGRFELNLSNPRLSARVGIPYTDRPVRFTGYFKYMPVDGDSAIIHASLKRWVGDTSVFVGRARMIVTTAVDGWTRFDLPFVYELDGPPDTIEVALVSSAGAEFFRGNPGSTLFVDDIKVSNDPTSIDVPQGGSTVERRVVTEDGILHLSTSDLQSPYSIASVHGASVDKGIVHNAVLSLQDLSRGLYFVTVGNRHIIVVK
jgi:hypothetical protein